MNFIHISAILFIIEVGIMMVVGKIRPLKEPYQFKPNPKVNMIPWKYAVPVTVILLSLVVGMYIVFSPIGFAYSEGIVSQWFWPALILLAAVTAVLYMKAIKSWNQKYAAFLKKRHNQNLRALKREKKIV
jgi:SSS family solute:Na+ symporter